MVIHFPLVDGSGYLHHSFIFWPLVALEILSRARDFNSGHLPRNPLDRRVARIVPMTPDFQISHYAVLVTLRLEYISFSGLTYICKLGLVQFGK